MYIINVLPQIFIGFSISDELMEYHCPTKKSSYNIKIHFMWSHSRGMSGKIKKEEEFPSLNSFFYK